MDTNHAQISLWDATKDDPMRPTICSPTSNNRLPRSFKTGTVSPMHQLQEVAGSTRRTRGRVRGRSSVSPHTLKSGEVVWVVYVPPRGAAGHFYRRFRSEVEAQAFAAEEDRRETPTETVQTLGAHLRAFAGRNARAAVPLRFVFEECASLLTARENQPKAITAALIEVATRRLQARRVQGLPSRTVHLSAEVREVAEGWEVLRDGEWQLERFRGHRHTAEQRLHLALSRLQRGKHLSPETLLGESSNAAKRNSSRVFADTLQRRGIVTISDGTPEARTGKVSRRTINSLLFALRTALPPHLRGLVPQLSDITDAARLTRPENGDAIEQIARALGETGITPRQSRMLALLEAIRANARTATGVQAAPARALAMIAATGMRSGEARALQWGDIDLVEGRITVRRWLDTHDAARATKTATSRRDILLADCGALGEGLLAELRLWRSDETDLTYCFAQGNGKPIRKEALRAPMAQALSAINAVGSLRPYAVRHCHAMVSLRGDLRMRDLDAIAQRLGHKNRAMLDEVYASRVIYDLS